MMRKSSSPIGVICDLDGLLVDSEALHFKAYQLVLREVLGFDIEKDQFVNDWLSQKKYGMRKHLEKAGLYHPKTYLELRNKKSETFKQLAKGKLKPMPGAMDFLKKLKSANIPRGVGTGVHRAEYQFMGEECGLTNYMPVFVGGNDVEKNKPAPDVFLEVARQIQCEPKDCLVLENSNLGSFAAKEAGMKCLVIPSAATRGQDFSHVDGVYDSLTEVDLRVVFSELFGKKFVEI